MYTSLYFKIKPKQRWRRALFRKRVKRIITPAKIKSQLINDSIQKVKLLFFPDKQVCSQRLHWQRSFTNSITPNWKLNPSYDTLANVYKMIQLLFTVVQHALYQEGFWKSSLISYASFIRLLDVYCLWARTELWKMEEVINRKRPQTFRGQVISLLVVIKMCVTTEWLALTCWYIPMPDLPSPYTQMKSPYFKH